LGELRLVIPRDREGEFQTTWVERYRRVEGTVDKLICEMVIKGVSTNKVGDILDVVMGYRLSKSYVSEATKELDESVREYFARRLDDDFVFLFLDGVMVKIRQELKAKLFPLLVAYGIRADGSRELISFEKVNSESGLCWQHFLENLKMRGLKGNDLKLIVMDGGKGLWQAVETVYPYVEHQLCWVHKLRNVSNHCPKRHRQECLSEARQIMYASSSTEAANRFRQWKHRWQPKAPQSVNCLETDFDKLIPVFAFPESIRHMIRTTNVIERCFREVRRRLKVMGYFPNSASCNRMVYALFAYFNSKWEQNNRRIKAIRQIFKPAA
jgi:transposase-like protein